jgi:hypothetical protein
MRFSQKSPISNLTDNRPVAAAALMHTNRRTDMTELMGTFHDHANAPKNGSCCGTAGLKDGFSFIKEAVLRTTLESKSLFTIISCQ